MMNSSKLKLEGVQKYLAVLVVLTFAFSTSTGSAEIKLTDNLSVSGFVDMSTVMTSSGDDEGTTSLSFDQFELDLHLNHGSVTGRVDVDSTAGEQGLKLEQGYVTYMLPEDMVSGVSITAGRFLSPFGFEAAEPTGLYQFSYSEGDRLYPSYHNGVGINVNPMKEVGIYVALLSGVWDVNDTDLKTPGIEAQLSLTPIEQVTAKVGYAMDDMDEYTQSEINAWASFTQGPLTLAGEVDMLQNWGGDGKNGMHFLGMANVSLKDMIAAPVALTVRFSGISMDDEDSSSEFTVSPSYAATDNWTVIGEFKQRLDAEETIIALESLFTY
jgi:hypothetical protein